jgi:hypothetical protein
MEGDANDIKVERLGLGQKVWDVMAESAKLVTELHSVRTCE